LCVKIYRVGGGVYFSHRVLRQRAAEQSAPKGHRDHIPDPRANTEDKASRKPLGAPRKTKSSTRTRANRSIMERLITTIKASYLYNQLHIA